MKLTLTTDDGQLLDTWYIPEDQADYPDGDLQAARRGVSQSIENNIPVYETKEEYESINE